MDKVVYFVLGAAAGSVATYFLVKEKFERQATEDIRAYQESVRDKETKETVKEFVEEIKKEIFDDSKEQSEDESIIFKDVNTHKEDYTEYGKPTKVFKSLQKDEPENKDAEAITVKPKEEPEQFPYIISGEDYSFSMMSQEKINVTLYDDGVLMNEDNQPVEVGLIGEENIQTLLTQTGEYADWLYVRNERIGCDFEIERVHHDFEDRDGVNMSEDGS